MIRHCVFVRYKPTVSRMERDAIYADLSALRTQLTGMGQFEAGANVNPEGLAKGFDEGFTIDFDDEAARDAYLELPDHKIIGGRLGAAAERGTDGIFVFDFKLEGQ